MTFNQSSLLLTCLFLLGTAFGQTNQEFEDRFHSRLYEYILNGEVEVKINNMEIAETILKNDEFEENNDKLERVSVKSKKKEKDPRYKVRLKACYLKDKTILKLASWSDLKEYFRFPTKDRVLHPILSKVQVKDEVCALVGTLKSRQSKFKNKSFSVSIMDLLVREKKSLNISEEGTYLKIDLLEMKFPFRKFLGSQKIETYSLLTDLLMNQSSFNLDLDDFEGVKLNVGLSLHSSGSQIYVDRDLATKPISNSLFMIDVLSKDKDILSLFYSDSGVWERYTIKEHTLRVLEHLNEQYSCHISPEFEKYLSQKLKMPLRNFMQLTMSLHDIGKPLAVNAGDKSRQHEFTRPVMEKILKQVNVPEEALLVALTLTDNDIVGDYLKGSIRLHHAILALKAQAQKTMLSTGEYFKLQMLFYTSDAASYPSLYDRVFKEDPATCCLLPQATKFKLLEEAMKD